MATVTVVHVHEFIDLMAYKIITTKLDIADIIESMHNI